MNSILRTMAIAMGMTLIAISPSRAADLTINFTGSFARGTCVFSVADVDLGTYAAPDFNATPTTPWKIVRINRNSCTSDISMINMTFSGTQHPSNPALWQVNTIGGLAVEMQNLDPQQVSPGTAISWPATWVRYDLQARFSRVSPITSYGAVSVPVTLTFTYN